MNCDIQDIIHDIKTTDGFQEKIDDFVKTALQMVFGIQNNETNTNAFSYPNLLKIASIFSLSTESSDKKLAYLIAIYVWMTHHSNIPDIIYPIKVILSRLSNFPAIHLLEQRTSNLCNLSTQSNIFTTLEIAGREVIHSVDFLDKVILTDFQKELWDYLNDSKSISFSAPTSAGKSFVLKQFIIKKITSLDVGKILYILPTRALINEANTDLRKYIKERNLADDILLTSIPTNKSSAKRIVYLLTQERASVLIETDPNIKFDLVVVDEAQSISTSQRGIILQNVIHDILENRDVPIVFSCPFVKNMAFFSKIFNREIDAIQNTNSTVVQNLITLNIKDSDINIVLINNKKNIEIGTIKSERKKSGIPYRRNRLAFLTKKFTNIGDKSIIFANGADDAEQISKLLYDELQDIELDMPTKDLISYVETHLHKDFSLALMLKRGIAFHYGNLPTNIRVSIEDIFKAPNGSIKFLICTSTLLEGVNLPAQNIFIENPEKGGGKNKVMLSSHEFWNLAGRAGRLAKDLYGNVFLVNYQDWEEKLADTVKEEEIKSSLYDTISTQYEEIIKYLITPDTTEVTPAIESTVNRMFSEYKRNNLLTFLDGSTNMISDDQKVELNKLLTNIDTTFITLPIDIARKNPHISIINQQKLYNHLLKQYDANKLNGYYPIHPTDASGYVALRNIIKTANKYLSIKKISDSHVNRIITLSNKWIKGVPIASMIEDTFSYEQNRQKKVPNINTIVRNILEYIERDIRFYFMIRVKCYIDIFTYILLQKNIELSLPPLHLFMEMGASQQSMISFMGIGLSRPTAKALDSLVADKDMNEETAYEWLKNNKDTLAPRGITGVTLSEIQKFV